MLYNIAVIAGFLFVALTSWASPPARVLSGKVFDASGAAIAGARVSVHGQGAVVLGSTTTNAEGRFEVAIHDVMPRSIEVSHPGFATAVQPIAADDTRPFEVLLAIQGLHEGIVVTATRAEAATYDLPMPSGLLDSRELMRSIPSGVAEALQELPGLYVTNAGPFRARPVLRGLDSNRVLVLVDGERLNNGRTSTVNAGIETGLVDVAQVERVEVTRGPGSVIWGSDAIGGVINLITRRAVPSEQGVRFGGRLGGEYHSSAAGRRGYADLTLATPLFTLTTSGMLGNFRDYRSPRGTLFNSAIDETGARAEARYYATRDQNLYVSFSRRTARDFGLPSPDPRPSFFAFFPFSNWNKWAAGYNGRFTSPVISSIAANAYFQDQKRDFFNLVTSPGFSLSSDTVTDTATSGVDVQLSSVMGRSHVLTYGANMYRDRNSDSRVQIMFPNTPRARVTDRAPSVPDSALTAAGFFLQDHVAIGRRLTLLGGARFDVFRLSVFDTPDFDPSVLASLRGGRTDTAVSANVGASYDLLAGVRAFAHLGRAFREPNLFERFFFGRGSVGGFVVPNPLLRPETSRAIDVGVRTRIGGLHASLTVFRNDVRDLIAVRPGAFNGSTVVAGQPVSQNTNIEAARIEGLELEADYNVHALGSSWTPLATLSVQRGANRTTGQPLPLIVPAMANVGLRWSHRRVPVWQEVRARILHGGDRVPAGFPPLQGFSVFSFRGGYEVRPWFLGERAAVTIGYAVENVTDKAYRQLFNDALEPGRNVRVLLDFRF